MKHLKKLIVILGSLLIGFSLVSTIEGDASLPTLTAREQDIYTGIKVYNLLKNKCSWLPMKDNGLYWGGYSFYNLKGAQGYDMKLTTVPTDDRALIGILSIALNVKEQVAEDLVEQYMLDKDADTEKTQFNYEINGRQVVFARDEYNALIGMPSLAVYIGPIEA